MKSLRHRALLAALACVIGACGQRGPLYLPQEPPPAVAPDPVVAPAATPVAPQIDTKPAAR